MPPDLVASTIEALPRHDFKNAFLATLIETVACAPQNATLTWLSEIGNAHVPGCQCPSFASLVKNSPFKE